MLVDIFRRRNGEDDQIELSTWVLASVEPRASSHPLEIVAVGQVSVAGKVRRNGRDWLAPVPDFDSSCWWVLKTTQKGL